MENLPPAPAPSQLMHRRVRFEFPPTFDPMWSPLVPEVAIATNAVSLVMPFVEPWVAASVLDAADELPTALADEARLFARQEGQHHSQHRRLNETLVQHYRGLGVVERMMGATFGFLRRHTSAAFGRAFAAGFETMAFAGASWVGTRTTRLFGDADPVPASLILWHLAEEAEHKGVAWDVHVARGGGRVAHAVGALLSLTLLVGFSALASIAMLIGERRILHPIAWLRLIGWSTGVMFEMLPMLAAACSRGFDPRSHVDPGWYASWLALYDPDTRSLPLWNQVG